MANQADQGVGTLKKLQKLLSQDQKLRAEDQSSSEHFLIPNFSQSANFSSDRLLTRPDQQWLFNRTFLFIVNRFFIAGNAI
jgi:hypothetical protein